jgi:putative redox protein
MDVKVTWKQKMSFEGTGPSKFTLPMGTTVESGGDNDGFTPMELILIGLAGCTGMDVVSILEKKRQQITGLEIKVHGDRANEAPRIFTDIVIEYVITGHQIDPAAAQRAVELSEEKYCSVGAMLKKAAKIQSRITILPE